MKGEAFGYREGRALCVCPCSRRLPATFAISAVLDGWPVALTQERPSPSKIVLRVGETGERITGEHDVRLQYRIRGLVTTRDGRPVLVWDLADTGENVPIDNAELTVTAPSRSGLPTVSPATA